MPEQKRKHQAVKPSTAMLRETQLPADAVLRRIFGKQIADAAKQVAHAKDDPEDGEQEQD